MLKVSVGIEQPTCPSCGSTDWTITGFGNHSITEYSYRLRCKRDTGRRDYQGKPILCGATWSVYGEIQNFPETPSQHFAQLFPNLLQK